MEDRPMSKRKLPQLKESHSNLMSHIADFVCQTVNISNRHTTEKVSAAYECIIQFIMNFWSQIFQTKSVTKDEDGRITDIVTVDGYLPLLTADELQALKLFLADYQKQLNIARNGGERS